MTSSGYRMQDLGSPNGTMVNGKRRRQSSADGRRPDRLGNSLLRFEHPPSRPPARASRWLHRPTPPGAAAADGLSAARLSVLSRCRLSHATDGPAADDAWLSTGPPSVVQPRAMKPPVQSQSVLQPSLFAGASAIAMSTAGRWLFLQSEQKQRMYLASLGGALLVGLIGLTRDLASAAAIPREAIDKATELYVAGTRLHCQPLRHGAQSLRRGARWRPTLAEIGTHIEACRRRRERAS